MAQSGALVISPQVEKAEPQEEAPSEQQQSVLPAQMTSDQFIQFFTLFSASPEMGIALAAVTGPMLEPGEPVENWRTQGIDVLAELGAMEGGLAGNLLRDADEEVLAATDLSGTVQPDWSGFESYALRPEPVGLVAERALISFVPGVWFEAAMQRDQRGTALCYGGYAGITLHTARPFTQWSQDELIAVATMFALFDRVSSMEVCSIYSKDAQGRYVTRSVLPDGSDLPVMNAENDPGVPMAPSALEAFLKSAPKGNLFE